MTGPALRDAQAPEPEATTPPEKKRRGRPPGVKNRIPGGADAVMLRTRQAAQRYSISETKLKQWIRENRVRNTKVGNIRLIEVASLEQLLGLAGSWNR
jgi:excisionase family DNA binding protein